MTPEKSQCSWCGEWFYYSGIARHEAMHREKRRLRILRHKNIFELREHSIERTPETSTDETLFTMPWSGLKPLAKYLYRSDIPG